MALYIDPPKGKIKQGSVYWFPTDVLHSSKKPGTVNKNMIMPEGYCYSAYGFKYHPTRKKNGKQEYWGLALANYNHAYYAGKYPCYKKEYAKPLTYLGKADTCIWQGVPFRIPSKEELEYFIETGKIGGPPKQPPKPKDPPKPKENPKPKDPPKPKEEKKEEPKEDPPQIKDSIKDRYQDKPMGIKTTRIQTEYDIFPEDYFSGCDVSIYFGDTWVDDITGINFVINENVMPIYGYASYTYDQVARGSRIVQGQFRIAFKEAGYLHSILSHIGQLKQNAMPHFAYEFNQEKSVPKFVAVAQMTIDEIIDYYKGNGKYDVQQFRLRQYEIEAWARNFTGDNDHRDRTFFYHMYDYYSNYNDKTSKEPSAWLKANGFDIYITYGPMEAIRWANGGKFSNYNQDVNTTVKVIRGVQLTSCSQVIDWSGEPIEEVYDFIAMDID
ncbi:MAG: hypothetical protein N2043_02200 [Ignavibacterium sp.]|nr:hypothetical protein [Ignavibacterium sp.]